MSAAPTVTLSPLHLSITQTFACGSSENMHLMQNRDIAAILGQGLDGQTHSLSAGDLGTLVISLGVDQDHDEVQYDVRAGEEVSEALLRAIEVLELARASLLRVH